jgi:hypothetical protein
MDHTVTTVTKAKATSLIAKASPKSVKPTTPKPATAVKKAPAKLATKPAPVNQVVKAEKPAKPAKPKKVKMVRDSMSIPKDEYVVLQDLKLRVSKLGKSVKKTEVLRAGIKVLAAMSDATLLASLAAVPSLKTGRPAKHG